MNVHTCMGPGMQDRTLSMFSEVTSTSFTATRTSPKNRMNNDEGQLGDILQTKHI